MTSSSSPNATDLSARSASSSAHYHPTPDTTDLTGIDATTIGGTGTSSGVYGTTGSIADTGFGTATYGNTDISGYRSANTNTYGGKRRTAGYDTESSGSSNAMFDLSGLTTGTRGYTGSAYDAGRTGGSGNPGSNNVSSLRASKGGGSGSDTGFGYGSGWRNTFDVGNAGNMEATGYGSRADYRGR